MSSIIAERSVSTDTATLVLFDEQSLSDKVEQECDWWTGEGDLQREEELESLAYIDTGSDGYYDLRIQVGGQPVYGRVIKISRLSVPSGELLFGAGECLPGEGPAIREYLGRVAVQSGEYSVVVYDRGERRFTFSLQFESAQPCRSSGLGPHRLQRTW